RIPNRNGPFCEPVVEPVIGRSVLCFLITNPGCFRDRAEARSTSVICWNRTCGRAEKIQRVEQVGR
ncbi:hypothetical protein pipiens_020293, partial [Culex pipiens pipiens]